MKDTGIEIFEALAITTAWRNGGFCASQIQLCKVKGQFSIEIMC